MNPGQIRFAREFISAYDEAVSLQNVF